MVQSSRSAPHPILKSSQRPTTEPLPKPRQASKTDVIGIVRALDSGGLIRVSRWVPEFPEGNVNQPISLDRTTASRLGQGVATVSGRQSRFSSFFDSAQSRRYRLISVW